MPGPFYGNRYSFLMFCAKSASDPSDNFSPVGNEFIQCGRILKFRLFFLYAKIALFRCVGFGRFSENLFLFRHINNY